MKRSEIRFLRLLFRKSFRPATKTSSSVVLRRRAVFLVKTKEERSGRGRTRARAGGSARWENELNSRARPGGGASAREQSGIIFSRGFKRNFSFSFFFFFLLFFYDASFYTSFPLYFVACAN